jgi:hypothetical protein
MADDYRNPDLPARPPEFGPGYWKGRVLGSRAAERVEDRKLASGRGPIRPQRGSDIVGEEGYGTTRRQVTRSEFAGRRATRRVTR